MRNDLLNENLTSTSRHIVVVSIPTLVADRNHLDLCNQVAPPSTVICINVLQNQLLTNIALMNLVLAFPPAAVGSGLDVSLPNRVIKIPAVLV